MLDRLKQVTSAAPGCVCVCVQASSCVLSTWLGAQGSIALVNRSNVINNNVVA